MINVDMMDVKDVRNKMLQSGIPLENTVFQEISQNGWTALPNIPIRVLGHESDIDVLARDRILKGSHNVCLDIPIHCKYRHSGVNWYFFGRNDWVEAYQIFNQIYNKKISSLDEINNVYSTLEKIEGIKTEFVATSAIQIPGERGKSFSKHLVLGAFNQSLLSIKHLVDYWDAGVYFKKNEMVLIVPIVVTTANMWIMKKGKIEDIENMEEPNKNDIMEQTDMVFFEYNIPDNLQFSTTDIEINSIVVPTLHRNFFLKFINELKENLKEKLK